jgi:hypothetical protein
MKDFITFRDAVLGAVLALSLITLGRAETTNSQALTAPPAAPAPGTKVLILPATTAPAAPADVAPAHSLTFSMNDDDDDKGEKDTKSAKAPRTAFGDFMEDIIPLWGILASFGMPVLVVFIVFYFRHRRRQDNLMLAREFLNKGLPVPPQLLDSSSGSYSREPSLPPSQAAALAQYDERKGIKYIFVGLGIIIAFHFYNSHATYWAWGVIPLVIGCGYLVSGRLARQREREEAAFRSTQPVPPTPPAGPSSQ